MNGSKKRSRGSSSFLYFFLSFFLYFDLSWSNRWQKRCTAALKVSNWPKRSEQRCTEMKRGNRRAVVGEEGRKRDREGFLRLWMAQWCAKFIFNGGRDEIRVQVFPFFSFFFFNLLLFFGSEC